MQFTRECRSLKSRGSPSATVNAIYGELQREKPARAQANTLKLIRFGWVRPIYVWQSSPREGREKKSCEVRDLHLHLPVLFPKGLVYQS